MDLRSKARECPVTRTGSGLVVSCSESLFDLGRGRVGGSILSQPWYGHNTLVCTDGFEASRVGRGTRHARSTWGSLFERKVVIKTIIAVPPLSSIDGKADTKHQLSLFELASVILELDRE